MTPISRPADLAREIAAADAWLRIADGRLVVEPARGLSEVLRRAIEMNAGGLALWLGAGSSDVVLEFRDGAPDADPLAPVLAAIDALPEGASVAMVEPHLRGAAVLAAGLDALAREAAKVQLIEQLDARKLKRAAKLVDGAFDAVRPPAEGTGSGTTLEIVDSEPWPEPVDGVALLDDLLDLFRRHVAAPGEALAAFVLWSVTTHLVDHYGTMPYLGLRSPEPEAGKSTTLDVLEWLVRRPFLVIDPTSAVLFRVIEQAHPTLLIDELDGIPHDNHEFWAIMNAGHTRGRKIGRCTTKPNGSVEVRQYDVFGPRAFGFIGKLPRATESRSIIVPMVRCTMKDARSLLPVPDTLEERASVYGPYRRRIVRWVADNLSRLAGARPAMPPEVSNRRATNWRPLLAVVDATGGDWPERGRRALAFLAGKVSVDDASIGVRMLYDLREMFEGIEVGLWTETILERLHDMPTRPWLSFRRGDKPMNPADLARILALYEIKPRGVKLDGVNRNGYRRGDLERAWGAWLPPRETSCAGESHQKESTGLPSLRENGFPRNGDSTKGRAVDPPRHKRTHADAGSRQVDPRNTKSRDGGLRRGATS